VNKRLVLVGIVLGIIVTFAVIVGSPAGPIAFDSYR